MVAIRGSHSTLAYRELFGELGRFLEEQEAHFKTQAAYLRGRVLSRFDHVSQYDADMGLRLPSKREIPIGFAHRGAKAQAKENTREAFDLAVKLGTSGIESDVWASKDGALVLHRQGHIGLRRRQIRSFARADLPDTIMTLPELIDRIPAAVDLSINVGHEAVVDPLFELVATLDPLTRSRLYLCHADWRLSLIHI